MYEHALSAGEGKPNYDNVMLFVSEHRLVWRFWTQFWATRVLGNGTMTHIIQDTISSSQMKNSETSLLPMLAPPNCEFFQPSPSRTSQIANNFSTDGVPIYHSPY